MIDKTLLIISIVTCLLIIFLLVHTHHVSRNAAPSKRSLLYLTYAAITAYIVAAATTLSYHFDSWNFVTLNQISSISWCTAQALIYTLLLIRIHFSFVGT